MTCSTSRKYCWKSANDVDGSLETDKKDFFPERVPGQMAFAYEIAVMTELAQADVSCFQGNKNLLNEAGSTSTPIRMAHLKRCSDNHYLRH